MMIMLIQMPKGFDPYVPKTFSKGRHSPLQNTALEMLSVMFKNDYALSLNNWLNKEFIDCRQAVSLNPWSYTLTLEDVIDNIHYEDVREALSKVLSWDRSLTYVFLMESFKDVAHYVWNSYAGYQLEGDFKAYMACVEKLFDKTVTINL